MSVLVSLLTALTLTAPTPILLRDIAPAPGVSSLRTRGSNPTLEWDPWVGVLPNGVVFEAMGGDDAVRLWITDGTPEGTRELAAVDALPAQVAGRQIFFRARPDGRANGLWRSDGTAAGTGPVTVPSTPDTFVDPLAGLGDRLLFANNYDDGGRTLWVTDGTAERTLSLSDPASPHTGPRDVVVIGDRAVFSATGEAGRELWATDGTLAGTAMIADLAPGPDSGITIGEPRIVRLGGAALFVAADILWRTDGTPDGTVALAEVHGDRFVDHFVAGDRLFFQPHTPRFPLWVSDGTAAGTQLLYGVIEVRAAVGIVGTRAIFFGSDRFDEGLWSSDGTAAGTVFLQPLRLGNGRTLTAACGAAACVFAAYDAVHGVEPWRSDGTAAGTALIADLQPGSGSSNPYGFITAGGRAVFLADDGVHGIELWQSNGAAGNARLVVDLAPGAASSGQGALDETQPLLAFGNQLLLGADDGGLGRELWALPLEALEIAGDCDGDGSVLIAELIRAVGVALGSPLAECPAADPNGDGSVAIAELVAAVNAAL